MKAIDIAVLRALTEQLHRPFMPYELHSERFAALVAWVDEYAARQARPVVRINVRTDSPQVVVT